MSLSTTPAPARTDTAPAGRGTSPAARPPVSLRSVRRAGALLTTGSVAWATGMLIFGFNAPPGWQNVVYEMSGLLFQVGLVALVTVQLRTGAIGTGRIARACLHLEHVLLGLAMVSTVLYAFVPQYYEEPWFLALDAFWPISMIGMFLIGIRIAIAGRWTGAARFWPLGAESWAPVNIPIAQLAPAVVSHAVAAGHLLLGYAALGLVLVLRPELTGARD